MKSVLLATVALLGIASSLVLATPYAANAVPIVNFGQTSGLDTITATADANGTTLTGTDVSITVTQIDNSSPLPATFPAAFLDFHATSLPGGAVPVGGAIVEHFSGSFTVTSGAGDTGTNYLSGTFADAAVTALDATQIAMFAPTTAFTSDVISTLGLPRAIGFTLTSVSPAVSLLAASGTVSGETLAPFTAAIAGNAAANAVPEPMGLALLGVGLLGLGLVRYRRS